MKTIKGDKKLFYYLPGTYLGVFLVRNTCLETKNTFIMMCVKNIAYENHDIAIAMSSYSPVDTDSVLAGGI